MYSLSLRDSQLIGTLAASVVCIGGVTAYLVLRRRPSPEEIERERRAQLVRTGRIIDGTILDTSDASPEMTPDNGFPSAFSDPLTNSASENTLEQSAPRFILYKYEIGGVAYECSQDVSALRDYFRPEELRLSFPCSVRYDIHRPENSIVIAENWSGLRATAQSTPARRIPRTRIASASGALTTPGTKGDSGK